VAGWPTTVTAADSGAVDPELPTPTGDVSDPRVTGLGRCALRASAHGISHVTAQRLGRRRSVVEHLINTSRVELSGLLL